MKKSRYTIEADLSECAACGALVSNEAKHTEWHHQQLAVLLALIAKYPVAS